MTAERTDKWAWWTDDGLNELTGPMKPMTTWDPHVRVRIAIFAVILALMFVVLDVNATLPIFVVLAAIIVIQPISARFIRDRLRWQDLQLVLDIALSVVASVVAPINAIPVVMCLVGLGTFEAAVSPVRRSVRVCALLTAALGVVVWQAERDLALVAAGLAIAVFAFHGSNGHRLRDLILRSRSDLQAAIHAAGGVTHLTDIEALSFDLGGDISTMLGYSNEEWKTLPFDEMVHPEDIDGMYINAANMQQGKMLDRSARFRHRDGHWVWLRDVGRVVMHDDRPYLHGFIIDVSAERAGLAEVTDQATSDELTGLANRRALIDELAKADPERPDMLVLIDLDRFKEVNDTMGHDAGDHVLCVVADRLRASIRPGDMLSRLGGDEFAVVLRNSDDPTAAIATVDRIALEVASPIDLNGVRITTSLSAGIAPDVSGPHRALSMLRHADLAMYAAKRSPATSVVFDQQLQLELERRVALVEGLVEALDSGALGLHFQPIVDTETGAVIGAEGLARWDHPTFGLLFPNAFLDVVLLSERAGEFTQAMVRNSLLMWQRTEAAGAAIPISVNIPVPIFEDAAFAEWFIAEKQLMGCEGAELVFEIAEGTLHRSAQMTAAIDRFSAVGVAVSIDDFGTGHATFERLRWLNVRELKIDRNMVVGAAADPRDRRILSSVAELAVGLGYQIVAEGVETVDQFEMLQEFGITRTQGWLFSKAVAPERLVEILLDGGYTQHYALVARTIPVL